MIAPATVDLAFCGDFQHMMAGDWPSLFNWPLFVLGAAIAGIGFMKAMIAEANRGC